MRKDTGLTGLTGTPKGDPMGVQVTDMPAKPKTLAEKVKTGFARLKVSEEDEAAAVMEIDQYVEGLTQQQAGKLARAIEKKWGARSASTVEHGGLWAVGRVETRPERRRKAKGATNEPSTAN